MTRQQKHELRRFLRLYPDGRLAALLAHAEDGKLSYASCCCFIGCLTADHPLRHRESGPMTGSAQHIYAAREIDSGSRQKLGPAERAFMEIASTDAERRRLVIPLIRGEQKRRAPLRASIQSRAVEPSGDRAIHEEGVLRTAGQHSGRAIGDPLAALNRALGMSGYGLAPGRSYGSWEGARLANSRTGLPACPRQARTPVLLSRNLADKSSFPEGRR